MEGFSRSQQSAPYAAGRAGWEGPFYSSKCFEVGRNLHDVLNKEHEVQKLHT